ncbi:hypothetical protein EU527_15880 [Candidatus Thorarchaeota archaeon]|nr:MAG: hypothetical protein EU527_15880 [Candidatus Thorarchaeota archaeon]
MWRGNYGNRGRGPWPGNGPFRHLPPWERPGWIYGRGSCWYYGVYPNPSGIPPAGSQGDIQILKSQKELLENQLRALQDRLAEIEKQISEQNE